MEADVDNIDNTMDVDVSNTMEVDVENATDVLIGVDDAMDV